MRGLFLGSRGRVQAADSANAALCVASNAVTNPLISKGDVAANGIGVSEFPRLLHVHGNRAAGAG